MMTTAVMKHTIDSRRFIQMFVPNRHGQSKFQPLLAKFEKKVIIWIYLIMHQKENKQKKQTPTLS